MWEEEERDDRTDASFILVRFVSQYEATDLDALGRLSNEFQFHVAAVHHAHEAHLVPSRLKTFFGGPPGECSFVSRCHCSTITSGIRWIVLDEVSSSFYH